MKVPIAFLVLAIPIYAESPTIKPATHDEIESFQAAQIDVVSAQADVDKAVKAYQDAFAKRAEILKKMYADRGLTEKTATICYGPGPGGCEKVAPHELKFLPKESK